MKFTANNKEFKDLQKLYKKAPMAAVRAEMGVLNDQAFYGRDIAIEVIKKSLIVRNERFVRSHVKVTKAKPSALHSIMGSRVTPRFSGWEEQEKGGQYKERVSTLKARGGNKRGQIKPKYRMKPGRKFNRPENYPGKNYQSKIRFMFRQMGSRRKKVMSDLFFIKRKYKRMTPGLYAFTPQGKIEKLQSTSAPRKIKKFQWMKQTRSILNTRHPAQKLWEKHVIKEFNKITPNKIKGR